MMAQLMDEIDRQLHQQPGGEQQAGEGQQGKPQAPMVDAAARALAEKMRAERRQAQEQSEQMQMADTSGSNLNPISSGEFDVLKVDRSGQDWGKLREQSAEDLSEGNRRGVAPEFRRSLEVYYRVLAERAKQQQK